MGKQAEDRETGLDRYRLSAVDDGASSHESHRRAAFRILISIACVRILPVLFGLARCSASVRPTRSLTLSGLPFVVSATPLLLLDLNAEGGRARRHCRLVETADRPAFA